MSKHLIGRRHMYLASPTEQFKQSFMTLLDDFQKNDPENAEFYSEAGVCFSHYVSTLNDQSKGVNLPKFYVPCHHFWLITEQSEVAGIIRIRHRIDNEFLSLEAGHIGYDIAPAYRGNGYGTLMLGLALNEAKKLGLDKVLITADEDNIASRKVIEANGGVLEKVIEGKVFQGPIARYWVSCDRSG